MLENLLWFRWKTRRNASNSPSIGLVLCFNLNEPDLKMKKKTKRLMAFQNEFLNYLKNYWVMNFWIPTSSCPMCSWTDEAIRLILAPNLRTYHFLNVRSSNFERPNCATELINRTTNESHSGSSYWWGHLLKTLRPNETPNQNFKLSRILDNWLHYRTSQPHGYFWLGLTWPVNRQHGQ